MTTAMMIIFTAAMTMMALIISIPTVEAQTECVSKLVPCASDLKTTTKPSDVCCSSIKEAVEKELPCLCTIYTTPGLLSTFNVTTAQALALSTRCNVTTDLSACSASKTPSPKSSLPPPPGKTGKDAGAGNKLAGYGITTVIFSLVAAIFF